MSRINKAIHREEESDEELVELVLAGQGEVFARLYERYHLNTYHLAWSMTRCRETAEDLTQEIFLRAYRKLGQFKGRSSFGTWFHRLAVNRCLNHRSREQKKIEMAVENLEERELPGGGGMEESLLQHQTQAVIHKALLSLKPQLRMVVILRNLEGLSYEEIAERMNCSRGTVGTWLNRAHKLLARKLADLKGRY